MLEQLRALATALVSSLNPKENAPKWGAAAATVVVGVLAKADLAIPPAAEAGLAVFAAGVIGKVVQRYFTVPRSPSPRAARARARREDRGANFADPTSVGDPNRSGDFDV